MKKFDFQIQHAVNYSKFLVIGVKAAYIETVALGR
jgi:hypothetical protein